MAYFIGRDFAELQTLKKWKWPYLLNWIEYCDERRCCNFAGFMPTMDLDETSVEVSQTYASSYEHGFNLTMT